MIFTVADAKSFCSKAIGSCNPADALARINEATQHLIYQADWKLLIRRVRVQVCNHFVTLPPQFDKVIGVTMDHVPGLAHSQYWEFLEGGPGRIDQFTDTTHKDLVDMGRFPTYADIDLDKTRRLIALSTEEADVDLNLTLRGVDADNDVILTSGIPGETLGINRWAEGEKGRIINIDNQTLSTSLWKRIDYLEKPVTKGYVTLYAYDPTAATADNAALDAEDQEPVLLWLGTYHPQETKPSLRRYRIVNHDCCDGDLVIMMVRLSYVPAVNDNDALLIQNLPALKSAIYGVKKMEGDDMNGFSSHMGAAIELLKTQQQSDQHGNNEFTVSMDYSVGDVRGIM